MTNIPKKLSDTYIRAAAPATKPYKLRPREDGLYLQINPTGKKWWRFTYTFGGKEKLLSFGVYPAVSLADARLLRDEARRTLAKGFDPSAVRKAEKADQPEHLSNHFETVARDWLKVKSRGWVEAHLAKETLRLEKHAFPWIGAVPIDQLGVDDLRPLLDRVLNAGHLEQAHRLRDQLSRIFRFAVATRKATYDPAHALSEVLPHRQSNGFPAIVEPSEIAELLRAIDGFRGTFVVQCALRLAPYLFCRPGELRMAEWADMHLDGDEPVYVVPPSKRKLRRHQKESHDAEPFLIPISPQALKILLELRALTGNGKYVFPGARDRNRPMSEAAINAALARIGFKGEMVGHAFRHMASTRLEELGWPELMIEAQLSHRVTGVKGRYKRTQHKRFIRYRRDMMIAWADSLDGLKVAGSNYPEPIWNPVRLPQADLGGLLA
ncbi:MAG: integrase arm-type DNA-binding domain-containing protein [Pseudomonadota bacterium]|nr:integrase arm-type DNA-binding domain-containing protein [Pseudomonadota bacterium]